MESQWKCLYVRGNNVVFHPGIHTRINESEVIGVEWKEYMRELFWWKQRKRSLIRTWGFVSDIIK